MMLSASERVTLTGYRRASAQIRWLRDKGWKFTVNALGEPQVAVTEFNRHMVGGAATRKTEPDWSKMHGPSSSH